ncbi:uncharacterized protein [Arachis hypogaea]|uniref:uncharacterized protein n=1 Tax=Arachis hypogaea TaxID=3818 RepID=UPI003B20C6FE
MVEFNDIVSSVQPAPTNRVRYRNKGALTYWIPNNILTHRRSIWDIEEYWDRKGKAKVSRASSTRRLLHTSGFTTCYYVKENGSQKLAFIEREKEYRFLARQSKRAVEFSWSIFNFQKDQDVRLRLGYEVFEQAIPNRVNYKDKGDKWTLDDFSLQCFPCWTSSGMSRTVVEENLVVKLKKSTTQVLEFAQQSKEFGINPC